MFRLGALVRMVPGCKVVIQCMGGYYNSDDRQSKGNHQGHAPHSIIFFFVAVMVVT